MSQNVKDFNDDLNLLNPLEVDILYFETLDANPELKQIFKDIELKATDDEYNFDDFMKKCTQPDKKFVNLFDVKIMEQKCEWLWKTCNRSDLKYPERLKIMAVYLKKDQGDLKRLYEIANRHQCRAEFIKSIRYSIHEKKIKGVSCEKIIQAGLCQNHGCYEHLKNKFGRPFPQDVCRL